MSTPQDGSDPAYPQAGPEAFYGTEADTHRYDGGWTQRQDAAIRLRVPASGEAWLDAMIRQSVRDEDARAALTGFVANDKLIQTSILMAKEDRSTPEAVIGQRCGKVASALAAARSVPATAPEQGEAAKTPEQERDAKAEALQAELDALKSKRAFWEGAVSKFTREQLIGECIARAVCREADMRELAETKNKAEEMAMALKELTNDAFYNSDSLYRGRAALASWEDGK